MRNDFGIFETNQDGLNIDGGIATTSAQTVPGLRRENSRSLNGKNAKKQDKYFKNQDGTTTPASVGVASSYTSAIDSAKGMIPFGINNPFSYPDTDIGSEKCVKNKSVLKKTVSYSEKHIEISDLEKCLPVAVGYMNNMRNMGVNVISQHFNRRYDKNGLPYFGIEEKEHKNHEVAIQMYVKDFDNYFERYKSCFFKRVCRRHKY